MVPLWYSFLSSELITNLFGQSGRLIYTLIDISSQNRTYFPAQPASKSSTHNIAFVYLRHKVIVHIPKSPSILHHLEFTHSAQTHWEFVVFCFVLFSFPIVVVVVRAQGFNIAHNFFVLFSILRNRAPLTFEIQSE